MEPISRALVLGMWEGFLICVLVDADRTPSEFLVRNSLEYYAGALGTALAVGVGGRLIVDYASTGEPEILARGVVGMAIGVILGQLANHVIDALFPPEPLVVLKSKPKRRRVVTHHDEDIVEGTIPPGAIGVTTTEVRTTTHARNTPIPIRSVGVSRDMLRAGRRDAMNAAAEDDDDEKSLERDKTAADGTRKRLKEEREWARAQGNAARQAELESEIKRYKALSEELERRLARRRSLYSNASIPRDMLQPRTTAAAFILAENTPLAARSPQLIHIPYTTQYDARSAVGPSRNHRLTQGVPDHIMEKPPTDSTAAPTSDEWSRALD